jgi:hypothetical protein
VPDTRDPHAGPQTTQARRVRLTGRAHQSVPQCARMCERVDGPRRVRVGGPRGGLGPFRSFLLFFFSFSVFSFPIFDFKFCYEFHIRAKCINST